MRKLEMLIPLFLIASGLRLYLDRLTRLRRCSGGDDEIALRCIYVSLYYLPDRSDCIDDGCAGRVSHETGKRLKTRPVPLASSESAKT